MVLTSESTPIMNWVKRSTLGFNTERSKSMIDTEWILEATHSWKKQSSKVLLMVMDGFQA
jgi:hypothetical protein